MGILSYPTYDFRYMKNTSARHGTVLSFTTWLTAWQRYASWWHLPITWRIHGSDWLPFTHMNGWFWWNQVGTANKYHTLILWESNTKCIYQQNGRLGTGLFCVNYFPLFILFSMNNFIKKVPHQQSIPNNDVEGQICRMTWRITCCLLQSESTWFCKCMVDITNMPPRGCIWLSKRGFYMFPRTW